MSQLLWHPWTIRGWQHSPWLPLHRVFVDVTILFWVHGSTCVDERQCKATCNIYMYMYPMFCSVVIHLVRVCSCVHHKDKASRIWSVLCSCVGLFWNILKATKTVAHTPLCQPVTYVYHWYMLQIAYANDNLPYQGLYRSRDCNSSYTNHLHAP